MLCLATRPVSGDVARGGTRMTTRPPRSTGLAHLIAATGYSLAGLRRLWREAAFRHEVFGAALVLAVLLVAHVPVWVLAVQVMLLLVLFAAEALNTAIEELVDHLTADWAQFAKNAKDLGSFSVMCLLVANTVWLLAGLWIGLRG
jgi:diacylglycerol kinase (ATP)